MLSFVMLLSMSVTAFAAEAPKAEEFANKYVVDGIAPVTQIDGSIYDNVLSLTIDIDDLIARSTNVTRSGSSYSGSYESDKYVEVLILDPMNRTNMMQDYLVISIKFPLTGRQMLILPEIMFSKITASRIHLLQHIQITLFWQ